MLQPCRFLFGCILPYRILDWLFAFLAGALEAGPNSVVGSSLQTIRTAFP